MRFKDMIFYHWTTKEALESIKEQGLVPHRGQHCKDIHDRSSDVVFLCREEGINFWKNCFWDVDVLIKVDCSNLDGMRFRNCRVTPTEMEYGCTSIIPPSCFLEITEIDRGDKEVLRRSYNANWNIKE